MEEEMKVELKSWQAFAILAVVIAAPHLNEFVALGFVVFCLFMAAIYLLVDKWGARDEP